METKPKKREWVKNAAILLLAGLLVLTFFSNTIMNRNLPEVATQYVTSGSINAKVRGTGTVVANGNHLVKADQTREIRAVMIRAGQKVDTGDVLFVLGSGDSAELEEAKERLYQLQLSYQRTALGGSASDYTADEMRVAAAWEAYVQAAAAVEAIESVNHNDAVDRLNEEINARESKIAGNEDQIDQYRAEIAEEQKALESAAVERDAYKSAYESTVEQAQSELATSETARLLARRDVIEYYEKLEPPQVVEEADLDSPQAYYNKLKENESEVPERELEVWKALAEADQAVKDANAALNDISRDAMDSAQAVVDQHQQRIDDLLNDVDSLQTDNEAMRSEIEEMREEIADHMSDAPNAASYRAAQQERDNAYLNYLDMKSSLDARKNADARANASLGLDLQDLNRQIEEQKQKIEELSGGEENQITANVSGTVQSVECTAGDTVVKDSVLCIIEVPDMGYTLSFSVTNDQAARLRVGDSASISNYYWGTEIIATLESIRVDPKNPQTSKLLTFTVSGDVSAGAELTVSVGQRSANYDYVVPKSAIHSDTNGSYVLKVESRNSPLGNRYYVRRVSVDILAQDDNSYAVNGDLGWGDYVITASSAPLKNGDLVRLSE